MVPPSLSILTQHFGRGGRSGEPTIAILLAETSVYQLQTGRASQAKEGEPSRDCDEDDADNNDDEDNEDDEGNSNNNEKAQVGPSYRKKLDDNLRAYIHASGCRRDISNEYFQNPPRTARKFVLLSKYVAIG
jgi:superfamily II DNA helicase RecQ